MSSRHHILSVTISNYSTIHGNAPSWFWLHRQELKFYITAYVNQQRFSAILSDYLVTESILSSDKLMYELECPLVEMVCNFPSCEINTKMIFLYARHIIHCSIHTLIYLNPQGKVSPYRTRTVVHERRILCVLLAFDDVIIPQWIIVLIGLFNHSSVHHYSGFTLNLYIFLYPDLSNSLLISGQTTQLINSKFDRFVPSDW